MESFEWIDIRLYNGINHNGVLFYGIFMFQSLNASAQ